MAKLQYKTISARTVEALTVEKDTVFWDTQQGGDRLIGRGGFAAKAVVQIGGVRPPRGRTAR